MMFSIIGVLVLSHCKKDELAGKQSTQTTTEVSNKSNSKAHFLGGDTTVEETSRKAFTLSARNLSSENKTPFFVGNSLFNKNWVQAPASASARDGLGPLFIARSCSACHTQDGRGRPPLNGEPFVSLLFRLSVKHQDGTYSPHPILGSQIQTRSLSNEIKEPDIKVRYEILKGQFTDGTPYSLEKPIYSLDLAEDNISLSPRVAQAVIGLGLLEAIPDSQLKQWADPLDKNKDGISGKINWVPNLTTSQQSIGRFGWKSNQPDLHQQVAAAFHEDLGITSPLFPTENHSQIQNQGLTQFESGGNPEISQKLLKDVVFYCQTLAVPAQRNHEDHDVIAGKHIFEKLNCTACHIPQVTTGKHPIKALSHQTISPFTDLLLHDMGEGLADDRPDFKATGKEWRTAPLWGIGLIQTVNKHTRFLHDGRARNIEEAILWHGGEAKNSQESYLNLKKSERAQLLKYLNSL